MSSIGELSKLGVIIRWAGKVAREKVEVALFVLLREDDKDDTVNLYGQYTSRICSRAPPGMYQPQMVRVSPLHTGRSTFSLRSKQHEQLARTGSHLLDQPYPPVSLHGLHAGRKYELLLLTLTYACRD